MYLTRQLIPLKAHLPFRKLLRQIPSTMVLAGEACIMPPSRRKRDRRSHLVFARSGSLLLALPILMLTFLHDHAARAFVFKSTVVVGAAARTSRDVHSSRRGITTSKLERCHGSVDSIRQARQGFEVGTRESHVERRARSGKRSRNRRTALMVARSDAKRSVEEEWPFHKSRCELHSLLAAVTSRLLILADMTMMIKYHSPGYYESRDTFSCCVVRFCAMSQHTGSCFPIVVLFVSSFLSG